MKPRLFLAVFSLALCHAWAQPAARAEDLEKRIAALPADEQAYERYRFWLSQLPAVEQNRRDLLERYRKHLIDRGRTAEEAASVVAGLEKTGRNAEVQRWNRILTAEKPRFNTEPNAFLVEMAKTRKRGTALDFGMGQGRNAIWLAQQGWDVTGFDPASQAVALARTNAEKAGVHLRTEVRSGEEFDFGEGRWDLILLSYVSFREIAPRLERALKPGGVIVVEGTHRDATKGRSIGGGVVFDTGELIRLFPALRVVRYEEPLARSDFGMEVVRVVRYCGERVE